MRKTVYFLGTKEIGSECLQILINHYHQKEVEIIGVLTNDRSLGGENKSVKELAIENNLKVIEDLAQFENEPDADFIISVQYHQILRQRHIDKATTLAVNLHMAPLPEYRGCNQFSFAIIDEAKTFGTTLHQLVRSADAGPILFEERFVMPDEIFVKELYQLTYEKSIALFKNHIGDIFKGSYQLTPQEQLEQERGCSLHFRKEIEALKVIDANWDADKKKRYFRATYFPPFEPPKLKTENGLVPLSLAQYQLF